MIDRQMKNSLRSFFSYYPSFSKGLFFAAALSVLIIGLSSPNYSYATHQSENLVWQVVMITSDKACSNYHHQMAEKYSEITEGYFKLYQQDEDHYQPVCLTEANFSIKYEKPNDLDLLIVAYDKNKGEKDLHSLSIGGLYTHSGDDLMQNHTIIFCDCSDFNYSNPTWILSHELSHFILHYLGFDLSIVEDEIHERDSRYDYCVENHKSASCEGVTEKIKSEKFGASYIVMAPYESAIGESFHLESEDIFLYDTEIQMLSEITKWWKEGKISDYYYAKSLEILSGVSSERIVNSEESLIKNSKFILVAEPPKTVQNDNSIDIISKSQEILENLHIGDFEFEQNTDIEIPGWFKTSSELWLKGEIKNDEFISGMDAFLSSEDPSDYIDNNDVSVEDIIEEGMIFFEDEEYLEAITFFDKAIWKSMDDGSPNLQAMNAKAFALFMLGNYDDSIVYYDSVLDLDAKNHEALLGKARNLAQMGQYEEAKKYFDDAVFTKTFL